MESLEDSALGRDKACWSFYLGWLYDYRERAVTETSGVSRRIINEKFSPTAS